MSAPPIDATEYGGFVLRVPLGRSLQKEHDLGAQRALLRIGSLTNALVKVLRDVSDMQDGHSFRLPEVVA